MASGRKNKKDAARKHVSATKKADRTYLNLLGLKHSQQKLVHLLTQTKDGRSYPINHRHKGKDGLTILHTACFFNLPLVVEAIIGREDVNVNASSIDPSDETKGHTPLHMACKHGHLQCVKLLCKAPGIDLNIANASDDVAFASAAYHGRAHVVKFFLDEIGDGLVDYNARCCKRFSALSLAASEGQEEVLKLLLADTRIDVCGEGATALGVATVKGHKGVVQMLLEDERIGHNSEIPCEGLPALPQAARLGQKGALKLLLTYPGIDVSRDGRIALAEAIKEGHEGVVKILLEDKRINQQHAIIEDDDAMDVACFTGSRTMMELLERYGFTPLLSNNMMDQLKEERAESHCLAIAEDTVLKDRHEFCSNCQVQFQRKSLSRCFRCLKVWYCSKDCFGAHWGREDGHKQHCVEIID